MAGRHSFKLSMVTPLSQRDQYMFELYLQACTDAQVYGVLEKEQKAGRKWYAALAESELGRRHLSLMDH